jgi:ELWxxDGT repeat protein
MFFSATTTANGRELWKSDGTPAGTVLVRDIYPAGNSSDPERLTAMGTTLYFTAIDSIAGRELWRSDGTLGGTVRVIDLRPGFASSNITAMRAAGDRLYFVNNDPVTGTELWISDGTAAGTILVDLDPAGSSSPQNLTSVGSARHLVFSATTPGNGRELWVTDGTAAGTRQVGDVNQGAGDSNPAGFARLGARVLFAAEEPLLLRELYEVPLGVLGASLVEPFGSGCAGTGGLVPLLDASPPLAIGAATQLLLTQALPLSPAWISLAWQRNPNASGCVPAIAPAASLLVIVDPAGTASLALQVPNAAAFVGMELFGQTAVLDPGGGFLGLVSLSQGLHLVVGS